MSIPTIRNPPLQGGPFEVVRVWPSIYGEHRVEVEDTHGNVHVGLSVALKPPPEPGEYVRIEGWGFDVVTRGDE